MSKPENQLEDRETEINGFMKALIVGIVTLLVMWLVIIPMGIIPIVSSLIDQNDMVLITNVIYMIPLIVVFTLIIMSIREENLMVFKIFKDWWNKTDIEYSKSYEYSNRIIFLGFIWMTAFIYGLCLMAINPDLKMGNFPYLWMGFLAFCVVIYFMFIMPNYTMKFPYIAEKVKHTVDGQELVMYKWDNKLFYLLSDIEIYEELDPKGIKFIDLKKKNHIENVIDADKLWDKIGESHKPFKVFEKPEITPELKKLMPDLIESEEE